MGEIKHTPGPWFAGESYGFSGRIHAQLESIDGIRRLLPVAEALGTEPSVREELDRQIDEETRAANARLIAAAPQMLEALQRYPVRGMGESAGFYLERLGRWSTEHLTPAIKAATGGET